MKCCGPGNIPRHHGNSARLDDGPMEHAPEFAAFIRDLMPDATEAEIDLAMQSFDDYILLLQRIVDRLDKAAVSQIRENKGRGV
jgi:hypothetical protein